MIMAFILTCKLVIGDVAVNFAKSIEMDSTNAIEIEDTWQKMTNTAKVTIAKRISVIGGDDFRNRSIADAIKVGDKVIVSLGYNGKLNEEFVGYVARSPKLTIPLEIECEDEMWQLKRKSVASKTIKNCKVSDLVKYIAPGYEYEVLDSELGTFPIGLRGPETAAQVLFRLEKESGLRSFFRTGTDGQQVLVVGKPFLWGVSEEAPDLPEVVYHLEENVIGHNLQYLKAEDRRIKIDAVSIKQDNKRLKAKFIGDEDGQTRSLHYYNISQEQLEKNAREDYNLFKQDGLEGDITAYGEPFTQSGQVARVVGEFYEKIDQKYFIDSVKKRFDVNGFRRINKIGFKASA